MYVAIVKETSKKNQVGYRMHLSAYRGGPVWARSAKYQTVEMAVRVAGDLFMGVVTLRGGGGPVQFHAEVEVGGPLLEREGGKVASEGVETGNPSSQPLGTQGEPESGKEDPDAS